MSKPPPSAAIDESEVDKFDALAESWWDPSGPMAPLHKLNPTRLAYIRERLTERQGGDRGDLRPLVGTRLLDVGCGCGLVAEPLTRLGAEVTAIDPSERNIEVARRHAAAMELTIDYRTGDTGALIDQGEPPFEAITCLEVIEHSPDPERLAGDLAELLEVDGVLVLSTLNRTIESFVKAIVGAEYLLGWLPAGTHSWKRFLAPSEVASMLRDAGLRVVDVRGFSYLPASDEFRLSQDREVNYILTAIKG